MKKVLAMLLTVCMLLSVIPAFGFSVKAAETKPETVEGLTLTSYTFVAHQPEWNDAYKHLMGQKSMGYQLNFDTNKMFDQTIDDLMEWSEKMGSTANVTGFGNPDDIIKGHSTKDSANYLNNYLIKWDGKVTAANDVKFTVVGNKIDNGFVLIIDGVRVYEYWGTAYFDKDEDKLPSDYGQVSLKKGDHTIEAWFLEIDGGAPLDMGVYLDGSTEYKGFGDAGLTFNMTATSYHTIIDRWGEENNEAHAWVKAFADAGQKKGDGDRGAGEGGNAGQCVPANQKYDATISAMLAASKKIGSIVVPRVDTLTLSVTDESYLNMYDGFVSVDETGYYLFGCEKVDNAFMVEIDGQRVYEFWANSTWNDNGSWAWMPESSAIYLEAGEVYTFKAAFAEFNGGQALWPRVCISDDGVNFDKDGRRKEMNAALNYTTVPPTDNDQVDASILKTEGAVWLNDKVVLDSVDSDLGNDVWDDSPVKDIFDNNKDTKMGAHKKWEGATVTWQTSEPTTVTHYQIRTSNVTLMFDSTPVAWVLLGSNDGKTYTIIDKVSRGRAGIGADNFSEGTFAVDTPAAYTYYKLQFVNTWNGNGEGDQDVAASISDLNLYNIPKPVTPPTEADPTTPPTAEPEYEFKDINAKVNGFVEGDEKAAQSTEMGKGVFWADHNWTGSEVTVTKSELSGNKATISFTHTGECTYGVQYFYNPEGTVNGNVYKVNLNVTSSVDTSITVNGTVYTLKAGEVTPIEYIVTADMHPEDTNYNYGTSVVSIQLGTKEPVQDIKDGEYTIEIASIALQTEVEKDPPKTGDSALLVWAVATVALLGTGIMVVAKKRVSVK